MSCRQYKANLFLPHRPSGLFFVKSDVVWSVKLGKKYNQSCFFLWDFDTSLEASRYFPFDCKLFLQLIYILRMKWNRQTFLINTSTTYHFLPYSVRTSLYRVKLYADTCCSILYSRKPMLYIFSEHPQAFMRTALRPPHRVLKAYHHPPIQRSSIAICILIAHGWVTV